MLLPAVHGDLVSFVRQFVFWCLCFSDGPLLVTTDEFTFLDTLLKFILGLNAKMHLNKHTIQPEMHS